MNNENLSRKAQRQLAEREAKQQERALRRAQEMQQGLVNSEGKIVGSASFAFEQMRIDLLQEPEIANIIWSDIQLPIRHTDKTLHVALEFCPLYRQGYITQTQADAAYKEISTTTFSSAQNAEIKAPWFVLYIKQLASQQFGEQMVENGGLQIYTTLDYNIEKYAEDVVQKEVKADEKVDNIHNAAAIVRDPKTGEILAMVGNADYFDDANDGQYNDAMASRQPGSSLKPILYATAFEKGYTPATEVMDVKTDFTTGSPSDPVYTPVNYNGKYNGPIQLRFALGNSLNIPAVKMLARVGIKDFMTNAYNMGISNWQPTDTNLKNVGLSLVLGGRETTLLDETTAYSVFCDRRYKA